MQKEDLKIGDHISFSRMENKAVKLSGTIVKIHDEGVPCVDAQIDESDSIATAHVDDVTLVGEGGEAKPAAKSLVTVNGKPI